MALVASPVIRQGWVAAAANVICPIMGGGEGMRRGIDCRPARRIMTRRAFTAEVRRGGRMATLAIRCSGCLVIKVRRQPGGRAVAGGTLGGIVTGRFLCAVAGNAICRSSCLVGKVRWQPGRRGVTGGALPGVMVSGSLAAVARDAVCRPGSLVAE